jgi:hypothetical protein
MILSYILKNPVNLVREIKSYGFKTVLFAMAISLGIHGMQHAYEEIYYDYNPFVNGKLLPKDMDYN